MLQELKDVPQGEWSIESREKLESTMEAFLAHNDLARFGFVFKNSVEGGQKVTFLIPTDGTLRNKLLDLANEAGLGVDSIEEFHELIEHKGFSLEARNEDGASWRRTRKGIVLTSSY